MIDFWLSLTAGLVGSFIIWLFMRVLSPMYLAWRYKAPKIEGKWLYYDHNEQNSPSVGSAHIKQTGEIVKAFVSRTTNRSGNPIARSFMYQGKIRGLQLLLNFSEPLSGELISGSLVLKISGDLKKLSGYTVYLDIDSGEVVAHPIWFQKI